jgi:phenylalanyl-tRNA synthetase beta chain
MVASEKELGISEEHEGIILLEDDAPVGMPLVDYMGDAVFNIDILPNMARNANVIGVARELAALTGRELKKPNIEYKTEGESVEELVSVQIDDPELNPRFVLGLIRDVEIKPSPYKIRRRLRLAGIRPISNVVDATNYAMLDQGEPLHAFDYDVLKERAGKDNVKISTRAAKEGEKLTTLDDIERTLTSTNVLVCDEKGILSLAGVMGGLESEVTDKTRNILLEGAAWNFINIRKTAKQHNLPSEASFRFSRGVHPSLAETGVRRGLQLMAEWSSGKVAPGLVDAYPLQPRDSVVEITSQDAKRLLGIDLTLEKMSELLTQLEFKCELTKEGLRVTAPSHRLDIGEGVVGVADVLEEVARSYGFDNIPETRMADALPPQVGNPVHEWEEHVRDILVSLGLQEVVSYRLTSPDREGRVISHDEYVTLANPIAPERSVMRRSLLASVLEVAESNARAESISLFVIGPVFDDGSCQSLL